MKVAILGGGAAGYFSAIAAKKNHPAAEVVIYEKSLRVLAKVKVSGGGRCNVTNACRDIGELVAAYPRGAKLLRKLFYTFNNDHAYAWFEAHGVPLTVQNDGCVFPVSQDSQSIIDCLVEQASNLSIELCLQHGVQEIVPQTNGNLELRFKDTAVAPVSCNKVIVATGGSPRKQGLLWLAQLGHKIEEPVPSLFTFNMPAESITDLMGIVVPDVAVRVEGSRFQADGPVLITHWGMSGPAILKLSAFAARHLSEKQYSFVVQANWVHEPNEELVLAKLQAIVDEHSSKKLTSLKAFGLPQRLWLYLINKCGFENDKKWGELGKKGLHRLVRVLCNDRYQVQGKTTFKEEFVTCGGVSVASIDNNTLQSKVCKNLYFAGEVLDIDGITGGYNFQAAWTTGFIAGKLGA